MTRSFGRRTRADRLRPRVLDVAPGLIHVSGPELVPDWAPERVAVMAHYSRSAEPTRSVVEMLRQLDGSGFETVVVSAAEADGGLARICSWAPGSGLMPERTTVLRRSNVGYDFGSWGAALWSFPGLASAKRVLLINDSLIGPFGPLDAALADFEACPMPVWGLSGSLQYRPHVQSFFVGYKDGVLSAQAIRDFWSGVRAESRKAKIVRYNELGLSETLDRAGIGWQSMFRPIPGSPLNPTVNEWSRLLREGFPFLKAEVVMAPPHWLDDVDEIERSVRRSFGQELRTWMPPELEPKAQVRPPAYSRIPLQARSIHDTEGARGLVTAGLTYMGDLWGHRSRRRL